MLYKLSFNFFIFVNVECFTNNLLGLNLIILGLNLFDQFWRRTFILQSLVLYKCFFYIQNFIGLFFIMSYFQILIKIIIVVISSITILIFIFNQTQSLFILVEDLAFIFQLKSFRYNKIWICLSFFYLSTVLNICNLILVQCIFW